MPESAKPNDSSKPFASDRPRSYTPRSAGVGLRPTTKVKRMPFMEHWDNGQGYNLDLTELGQAIRATDAVLAMAKSRGSHVRVLCTTMTNAVRDDLWYSAAGITYGDRLEQVANAGGRVQIIVAADYAEEKQSFSPSVLNAIGKFGAGPGGPVQIVYDGEADFFSTFPHFTITNKGGGQWFSAVEWKSTDHDFRGMVLDDSFQATAYGCTAEADEVGNELSGPFDRVFHKLTHQRSCVGFSGTALKE